MSVVPPQYRPAAHFITRDTLNQSAIQGLASNNLTQYLRVTKLTIQKYLEACLRPDGQFRRFFAQFASWMANFSINENLTQDPSQRTLQIASFFGQTEEQPPQIFIQDAGYEYVPSGLGGISGFNSQTPYGQQVVQVMDVIKVPIQITVAALNEQSCEDLQAFLTAAFQAGFQRFTVGWTLCPPHPQVVDDNSAVYWEVRLPLQHRMSAKTHTSLHNDPVDQIWEATCSMDVVFENSVFINYRAAPIYDFQSGTLQIVVPDKISLRRPSPVSLIDVSFPFRIYSDDPTIAIIEQTQTQFRIRPKRLGTFNLIVARVTPSIKQPQILKSKSIEVVAR